VLIMNRIWPEQVRLLALLEFDCIDVKEG